MWTFRAMDTEVWVDAPSLGDADAAALARAVAGVFADAERRFSRFDPDSELSRLNGATGPFAASRELLETLTAARRQVEATDGLFDPTIGAALEAAGYDRTFADVSGAATPGPAPRHACFADLRIDDATGVVVRPSGIRVDLGGIVKGRAVDRAAALVPSPGLVEAGGDARLRGAGPHGDGWLIDVEDPAEPRHTLLAFRVTDRAVATSAPNRRRWRSGAGIAHHLIDPRTMRPASSDLAQATAVAARAEDADVLAKAAFLLGADAGARLLERHGASGVLVGTDGAVRVVGDLEVVDA